MYPYGEVTVNQNLLNIEKDLTGLIANLTERCVRINGDGIESKLNMDRLELKSIKKNLDLSSLKKKEISRLRGEEVKVIRGRIMDYIKAHISQAQSALGNRQGQYRSITTVPTVTENLQRMGEESKRRECRGILRNLDTEGKDRSGKKVNPRSEFLKKAVADKDEGLIFLQSLQEYPSEGLISEQSLDDLIFAYTSTHHPEAVKGFMAAKDNYASVRELCASFNAEAARQLLLYDVEDPVSFEAHCQVFPPLSGRDKEIAAKRLLAEQRQRDKEGKEED